MIVSSERKEVLPLCPEPILKQDGQAKNDCERNASKRFLDKLRLEYPHLPPVMVEDALSSNVPHIAQLKKHGLRFILGVKESDHAHLFAQVQAVISTGNHQELTGHGLKRKRGHYRWVHQLELNASNPNVLVNLLQDWETDTFGKTTSQNLV